MRTIGTLAALWRYPVKSLRGQRLRDAMVLVDGLEGDRTSALIVRDGHVRVGKTLRGKEHDRLHLIEGAGDAVASACDRGVGVDVEAAGRYFDAAPVSLVVDRWLDGLRADFGYAVEYERFRPNFYVETDPSFDLGEAAFFDRELHVGEVRLRVRCGIERCVAITYDPAGGKADPRILRYVAQQRDAVLGIYCDVLQPGTVRPGDTVRLDDTQA
jgi:uncharacterized protein YcbX